MKEVINNIVLYRLQLGQSKDEIVTGLFHTICNALEVSHAEALIMIRHADDQKAISDAILKAYQPDHAGLQYNKLTNSRVGKTGLTKYSLTK